MSRRIVTISREFGSGGRFIGEELAKRLGIAYYDKEIIAKVAEETGLAKEFVEQNGEYAPSKSIFSYAFIGRGVDGASISDYVAKIQREVILEAAEKEPCVIVGRGSNYILKERTDCMNVFIHGDMKAKTERIMKLYEKSEEEAKNLIHVTDKKRSVNHKYYTEQDWGAAKNYTISLNSNEIGYDRCIDLLESLYREL